MKKIKLKKPRTFPSVNQFSGKGCTEMSLYWKTKICNIASGTIDKSLFSEIPPPPLQKLAFSLLILKLIVKVADFVDFGHEKSCASYLLRILFRRLFLISHL